MESARLKKRAEFGQVFKRGRTYGDRYLVLFVLRTPTSNIRRVGFTAQRAVGSAVRRNRVRRRLKALYHFYEDSIFVSGDLIFLGKKSMIDAPWDELLQSTRRVLRKAGCLQE